MINWGKIYGFGGEKGMDMTRLTTRNTRNNLRIVSIGPRHPSLHGVLQLIMTLDVEDDVDY